MWRKFLLFFLRRRHKMCCICNMIFSSSPKKNSYLWQKYLAQFDEVHTSLYACLAKRSKRYWGVIFWETHGRFGRWLSMVKHPLAHGHHTPICNLSGILNIEYRRRCICLCAPDNRHTNRKDKYQRLNIESRVSDSVSTFHRWLRLMHKKKIKLDIYNESQK